MVATVTDSESKLLIYIHRPIADISMYLFTQAFKSHNDAWPRTKVSMTDKDMTERNVFSIAFPAATLQLCLFHTLCSFSRGTLKGRHIKGEQELTRMRNSVMFPFYMRCSYCCFAFVRTCVRAYMRACVRTCVRVYIVMYFINSVTNIK